ncbi:MAG: hypothetical protein JWN02_238, partial [Acidobacteria bacterium]|nr:hypothetical protein [Acidobacteriota bacterium]
MNRPFRLSLQLLSAILILCATLPASAQTVVATASHAVAIRNVRLFDGLRVTPNATVLFEGGTI